MGSVDRMAQPAGLLTDAEVVAILTKHAPKKAQPAELITDAEVASILGVWDLRVSSRFSFYLDPHSVKDRKTRRAFEIAIELLQDFLESDQRRMIMSELVQVAREVLGK